MSIMCLLFGELLVFLLEVARCRFAQKSPNKEVRTDSLQRFTSNSQRQAAQTAPFTPMSEPTIFCFLMQRKIGWWFSLFMTPKNCEHSCKFDVSKNPHLYIYNTRSQFFFRNLNLISCLNLTNQVFKRHFSSCTLQYKDERCKQQTLQFLKI